MYAKDKIAIYTFSVGDYVDHLWSGDKGIVASRRMDDNNVPLVSIRLLNRTGYLICREYELRESI